MDISIVIPIYNEEKNLPLLLDELLPVVDALNTSYEIILVDDGSHDNSRAVIETYTKKHSSVRSIIFAYNAGQTAALAAGFNAAQGNIIIPLDSDGENDPADIPELLKKYNEGFDVVSGWRKNRWKGQLLTRKLPSWFANTLISGISGIPLHDYGCTLKIYNRIYVQDVSLYGEMHRFIPALAAWKGARVTEVVVNHRPRKFGKSNYGFSRTFRVILDLVTLKFLTKYLHKPMHFFGGAGLISIGLGVVSGLMALYYKFSPAHQKDFVETPLPVITSMLIILGVLFILMGLLAEMLMRTYFESQKKTPYVVKEKINFS